jgi:hypothetical protein
MREVGAGDRIRTGDINLGKVALYQLSYSRAPTIVHPPVTIVNSTANLEWKTGETRVHPNVLLRPAAVFVPPKPVNLKATIFGSFLFSRRSFVVS